MKQREEINYLRGLAEQVRTISRNPVHDRNRRRWAEHNSLCTKEPLLLVFPECGWDELLPEETFRCNDPDLRQLEFELRSRIYHAEHLHDDAPIPDEITVTKRIMPLDWGLNPNRIYSDQKKGAYEIEPVLVDAADAAKLRIPEVIYDEERTLAAFNTIGEAVGDILPVRLKGEQVISFHFTAEYIDWRGLDTMLLDFYLEPELLHDVMQFLVEAYNSMLDAKLAQRLLSYNSDQSYHSSGGNGFIINTLNWAENIQGPYREYGAQAPHRQGDGIDLKRMWGSAESQEMAVVGPGQHREFVMRYEAEVLKRFGLTGYGCCEDLTRKIEAITELVPNLRRISISPWADVQACAEQLQGEYIFSWKPNPAHFVGDFNEEAIRAYIRNTLAITRREGNVLEIILKDTHTCEHHPERFDNWIRIVREELERSSSA